MNVKEFEDKRWLSLHQKKEFRHNSAYSLIAARAAKTPLRVLDIGCGDGLLLSMLTDLKNVSAEGVDISEEAVTLCKNKGLVAQVLASADSLPFKDDEFDVVVMLDILEHVYDPLLFLTEAKRVSRSAVVIGVPNFSSLPARFQVLFGKVPENNAPNKAHVYWFNDPVLRKLLSSAELRIVNMKMNTFSLFRKFGTLFQSINPNVFALSFVVEAEK